MSDCICCKMAAGEIPCSQVYEDEAVLAFMDLCQPERGAGHVLIIPKEHAEDIHTLSPELLKLTFTVAGRIATAVKSALQPDGILVWQSNGKAAGQVVPHFHLHVMAQWEGDGYELFGGKFPPQAEPPVLSEAAARIKGALGG
jgi:histidine triad (HIT) family protein